MTSSLALYIPFELPRDEEVGAFSDCLSVELSRFPAALTRNGVYHALVVSEIPTKEEAHTLFDKLEVALYWTALEQLTGIKLSSELQNVYADGVFDGTRPAFYGQDDNVLMATGGRPEIIRGYNAKRFFECLKEGLSLQNSNVMLHDPKLKLGIELYMSAHYEVTASGRFLALFTALEALARDGKKLSDKENSAAKTRDLITKWVHEAKILADCCENKSDQSDLRSLAERLGNLKTRSHTVRIQDYVRSVLTKCEYLDADASTEVVKELYAKRGRLLHDGKLDELSNADSRLDHILSSTLKAAIRLRAAEGE